MIVTMSVMAPNCHQDRGGCRKRRRVGDVLVRPRQEIQGRDGRGALAARNRLRLCDGIMDRHNEFEVFSMLGSIIFHASYTHHHHTNGQTALSAVGWETGSVRLETGKGEERGRASRNERWSTCTRV